MHWVKSNTLLMGTAFLRQRGLRGGSTMPQWCCMVHLPLRHRGYIVTRHVVGTKRVISWNAPGRGAERRRTGSVELRGTKGSFITTPWRDDGAPVQPGGWIGAGRIADPQQMHPHLVAEG